MENLYSAIFSDYGESFENGDTPFLFYYRIRNRTEIIQETLTRRDFLSLAQKGATVLREAGCLRGDRVLHCFGCNDYRDLAFRVAGVMLGTTPVTINWQADNLSRILFKFRTSNASLIIYNDAFDTKLLSQLQQELPDVQFFNVKELGDQKNMPPEEYSSSVNIHATKMIIFTSGTTGRPKGVELTYQNYKINRRALETMLQINPDDSFATLVVNPMHHTNSTAITDWAIRRPGAQLHLMERYSTQFWKILTEVTDRGYDRLISPMVSRHFDFLEELLLSNRLPVEQQQLARAMKKVDILIGSAPVGPTTVERIKKFTGRIPAVRFGSTETCLQVIGIPESLSDRQKMDIFRRGWEHQINGQPQTGYYIGRPHAPHTEAKIVKSINPDDNDFMQIVEKNNPGYLVIRGGNVMKGYVNDPEKTARVFHDNWYLGLEDICFALTNPDDGRYDYYWMSRDSSMLIRGGANYSCDQINAELNTFLEEEYGLPQESFHLATAGIKVDSEHEDACCITIELLDDRAQQMRDLIETTFMEKSRASVSKGAKPDHLRFAKIPLNFKGAIILSELKKEYAQHLKR